MARRKVETTIPVAVQALMNASTMLQEPGLDDVMRDFAQSLVDKSQGFLFERQDEMRCERERLLEIEDVESLAIADFITLLLRSYDDAARAAADVLAKAAKQEPML
jgi:hypothetical protein